MLVYPYKLHHWHVTTQQISGSSSGIARIIRLGLSTTLTSEDKNGDFETSLKVKNKDYILMYDGLGAKIENISTNEVIYPINHYFAL